MNDNSNVKLGSCLLHFWNTPGHTLESNCIFLCHREDQNYSFSIKNSVDLEKLGPKAVFTGDTLFIGDVGRPDLAVSKEKNISKIDLSNMMYNSIQRFKELPNDIILYPGHGAGSACGKNISNATSCTLGNQKENNYAFLIDNKEEFIIAHTENIPPPPDYFFHDVKMNQNQNIIDLELILKKANKKIKSAEFYEKVQSGNYQILDCRFLKDFSKGFVPGSFLSPINGNLAITAAQLINDYNKPILLVCYPNTEQECIKRLARTGIENIHGYLHTFYDYFLQGFPYDFVDSIEPSVFFNEYYQKNKEFTKIIDVRGLGEFNTQHVDSAINIPLPNLNQLHQDMLKEKHSEYFIHCLGGVRSVIAYSYLKSKGYTNIKNVLGGFEGMLKYGFRMIPK